ncbi:MAG: hypothetical protein A2017_19250 [Lentisphaerae bacterium GWF2_44_16]|nr:MAG: hypothetical protein A2017_19250 [Lentisphaerae bacterium GWF2_44_16]
MKNKDTQKEADFKGEVLLIFQCFSGIKEDYLVKLRLRGVSRSATVATMRRNSGVWSDKRFAWRDLLRQIHPVLSAYSTLITYHHYFIKRTKK